MKVFQDLGLPDLKTNLLDKIITSTKFELAAKKKTKTKTTTKGKGSSKKRLEEAKANEPEVILALEIDKELFLPQLRWVPDKVTLQRLVMRYVNFKDDFKGFDNARETLSRISGLM